MILGSSSAGIGTGGYSLAIVGLGHVCVADDAGYSPGGFFDGLREAVPGYDGDTKEAGYAAEY